MEADGGVMLGRIVDALLERGTLKVGLERGGRGDVKRARRFHVGERGMGGGRVCPPPHNSPAGRVFWG